MKLLLVFLVTFVSPLISTVSSFSSFCSTDDIISCLVADQHIQRPNNSLTRRCLQTGAKEAQQQTPRPSSGPLA